MATKEDQFGQIVLEMGLIDENQLKQAIELQRKGRMRIGDVMVQLLILRPEQVDKVLQYQKKVGDGKQFGVCAVKMGLINEEQRILASKFQNEHSGILGDMLVDLGFLSEEQRQNVVHEIIEE